jgi:hypothetical protein
MKIKHNIHEYLKKHGTDNTKLENFAEFIENFFESAEEGYMDMAEAFCEELEEFVFELDEEMAAEIVNALVRRDGTPSGMKWSHSETDIVAKQNAIPEKIEAIHKRYDSVKFWLAMNYVYAVHYNINRTVNGYIELAMDEMTNKNICFDELIKGITKKL